MRPDRREQQSCYTYIVNTQKPNHIPTFEHCPIIKCDGIKGPQSLLSPSFLDHKRCLLSTGTCSPFIPFLAALTFHRDRSHSFLNLSPTHYFRLSMRGPCDCPHQPLQPLRLPLSVLLFPPPAPLRRLFPIHHLSVPSQHSRVHLT